MAMLLRLLGRLWRALDGLRKGLHLVLLLALFALLWAVLHPPSPVLPARAALVVHPQGRLVEQLSGDAVDRAYAEASGETNPETLVKELTDTIRSAAHDSRIALIVLDLADLSGGAQSKLAAVAAALAEFRAAGKKVIAHGGYVTQEQYYLMAGADEIWLEPSGAVVIDGYASYRHYLREALDKLGVTVNVFKVGTYKSAIEEYTLTQMSAADREQTEGYLKPLWASYAAAVEAARKLEPGTLTRYVDGAVDLLQAAHGDAAAVAIGQGLATGRKTRVEFEAYVAGLVGEDRDTHGFSAVDTAQYAAVALPGGADEGGHADSRVAVLTAVGTIKDGEQPPGEVGGDSLARLLHEARFDKSVKAVVLRIDSPGGSVQASERIRQEVEAVKAAGKPVVASFAGVAASGGYYIAMDADQIYAEPTTITGSIGVFAILPTFEHVLARLGVHSDGVATSALAGALDLTRELSPQVSAVLQTGVEYTYAQFVGHVAAARHRTPEEIDAIAQGRVWIAADAKERGLVDAIGGQKDAVAAAARLAGLKDGQYGVSYREKHLNWRETLVRGLKGEGALLAARLGFAGPRQPALASALGGLERSLARLAAFNDPRGIYLYCDCEPR